MIFARNWGTEGFCSNKNHVLDVGALRVLLPRVGASAPKATLLEFASTYRQSPLPAISYSPRYGTVVTFSLPSGESSPLQELVLSLDWGDTTPTVAGASVPSAAGVASSAPDRLEAERYLEHASTDQSKGRTLALQNSISQRAATQPSNSTRGGLPLSVPVSTVQSFDALPPPSPLAQSEARIKPSAIQQSKERGDAAALAALCAKYNNALPDREASVSASACSDAKKVLAK